MWTLKVELTVLQNWHDQPVFIRGISLWLNSISEVAQVVLMKYFVEWKALNAACAANYKMWRWIYVFSLNCGVSKTTWRSTVSSNLIKSIHLGGQQRLFYLTTKTICTKQCSCKHKCFKIKVRTFTGLDHVNVTYISSEYLCFQNAAISTLIFFRNAL